MLFGKGNARNFPFCFFKDMSSVEHAFLSRRHITFQNTSSYFETFEIRLSCVWDTFEIRLRSSTCLYKVPKNNIGHTKKICLLHENCDVNLPSRYRIWNQPRTKFKSLETGPGPQPCKAPAALSACEHAPCAPRARWRIGPSNLVMYLLEIAIIDWYKLSCVCLVMLAD